MLRCEVITAIYGLHDGPLGLESAASSRLISETFVYERDGQDANIRYRVGQRLAVRAAPVTEPNP